MIVVAIIGILAAIAIPAYQDYTIRSQVTEGMNLAGSLKAAIAEQYAQTGAWATDLDALGLDNDNPPSGKYVVSVAVDTGTINITYGNQANANIADAAQNVLSLKPMLSANDDVIWLCGYNDGTNIDPAPVDPDSGASADDATTVLSKYLPQSCRVQVAP
jgi:type IV pilus assembly protein PilA